MSGTWQERHEKVRADLGGKGSCPKMPNIVQYDSETTNAGALQ